MRMHSVPGVAKHMIFSTKASSVLDLVFIFPYGGIGGDTICYIMCPDTCTVLLRAFCTTTYVPTAHLSLVR